MNSFLWKNYPNEVSYTNNTEIDIFAPKECFTDKNGNYEVKRFVSSGAFMTMLCYPEIFEVNSELKSIKYIGQIDEPVVENQLLPVERIVTAEPDQNLSQDYQIQDEIRSKMRYFSLTRNIFIELFYFDRFKFVSEF